MSTDASSESTESEVHEQEIISSGEEEPMTEWTSLQVDAAAENPKKLLYEQGLYSPGTPDVCTDYVSMSASTIPRHPYFNYPAVLDPGIEAAILGPEPAVIYPNDGQKRYLDLCSEMNTFVVRLFHNNLTKSIIDLSYYGVDPKGVRAMAKALHENPNVNNFDLTDNFLTDDSCFHLGEMLKVNNALVELILAGCRIGSSGLKNLCTHLKKNKTLRSLNLARNQLKDAGGVVFGELLCKGMNIENVNLSYNELGRDTAVALAEGFTYKNCLTNLDLSWNKFVHIPSTVKMFEALVECETLKELNLSYNSLEGERVANALYHLFLLPKLTTLNLRFNRLQGEPLMIMAAGLLKAKNLVTLDLSNNPLSPKDACDVLTIMLKPRPKLQNLLLECIPVNKTFVALLKNVKAMKSRKNFKTIYGLVLADWIIFGPDMRNVVLQRADYMGRSTKKNRFDIALFFLALIKEKSLISVKNLRDKMLSENINIPEDLVIEMALAFSGPKSGKYPAVNIELVCDYIARIWPERELPPTPPPEPEEPVVVPEPKNRKNEKEKSKKK